MTRQCPTNSSAAKIMTFNNLLCMQRIDEDGAIEGTWDEFYLIIKFNIEFFLHKVILSMHPMQVDY